ncbi:MAG: hypothetical protein IJP44_05925 [Bacteroidales bacterium]|nr:hypothetical protein [Bacteroidales bacterium]
MMQKVSWLKKRLPVNPTLLQMKLMYEEWTTTPFTTAPTVVTDFSSFPEKIDLELAAVSRAMSVH